jgi:hypothetical protein
MNATGLIVFWIIPNSDIAKAIEVSSHFAMNRIKLLYIDHGLRIKDVSVYFPTINIGYTMKTDYRYPLEVMIEMAAAGLTLGGNFDRLSFEPKTIEGLCVKV